MTSLLTKSQINNLTPSQKNEIKKEVGEMLIDLVLKQVSEQKSITTDNKFEELSEKYAKEKSKVAQPVPNLELTGSMLDALEVKPYKFGIEYGIFKGESLNGLKAENHNKFTRRSKKTKLPQRQFIPRKTQRIHKSILDELKSEARDLYEDFIFENEEADESSY